MKRAATLAVAALLVLAVIAGGLLVAARNGWLTPDEASLRARYALPTSRFVTIDGQSIHYVDEGHGPPVMLVHGSFASLRMWDVWADALKDRYRVVRFDRPSMGLDGADPQGRGGPEREADLIGRLATQRGLGRFVLVATSSGGEAAAAFAAAHPERVLGVILANIAAGPLAFRPAHYPVSFRVALAIDPYLAGWHTTMFWRGVLSANYADPAKVTPQLVREWTDLNNRAQFFPRQPRPVGYVPFARTPADLAAIRAPTLLLWSDSDPEVPLESDGRSALQRLGSADKRLVVIPHCGHMMPLECGPQSVAVARAFLDHVSTQDTAR